MPSTEKGTQHAVLNYLTLKRVFHWRNNTGALRTERGGFVRFGSPGSPDIFAVVHGRLLGIEVKDEKGRLNPDQEAFRDGLEAAGGTYIVARSLDDVMAVLN